MLRSLCLLAALAAAAVPVRALAQPGPGELPAGQTWFRDTNVTRHLYSPTGFMLRQGEGYLSQKEVLLTSFGYGVTDNVSVMVGSVVPGWFLGAGNLFGGVKLGVEAADVLHLAVGFQALYLPVPFPGGTVGALHATATYGTRDLNLTLSAATLVTIPNFYTSPYPALVIAGGMWRVSSTLVLQTEHWFIPQLGAYRVDGVIMFNSVGVRVMVDRNLSMDLGIARVPKLDFPLPWLDVTWAFGS